MTKKIRITKTPAGFAPQEIRDQWVGVEIPLMNQEDADKLQNSGQWNASEQHGGPIVHIEDAINALKQAGKTEAASFWNDVRSRLGTELRFGVEYCEYV